MVTAKGPVDTKARVAFDPRRVPKSLDDMGRILHEGILNADARIAEIKARPKKEKLVTPATAFMHPVATSLENMSRIPDMMAVLVAKEKVLPIAIDPARVKTEIVSRLAAIKPYEQDAKTRDFAGKSKAANVSRELAIDQLKEVVALNLQLAKHFEKSDKAEAFEVLLNASTSAGKMACLLSDCGKETEAAKAKHDSMVYMDRASRIANLAALG